MPEFVRITPVVVSNGEREYCESVSNIRLPPCSPSGEVYEITENLPNVPIAAINSTEEEIDEVQNVTLIVNETLGDICSLDIGSFNFGPHIFVNSPENVNKMAQKILDIGVKPELEVFDLGGLRQAKELIKNGYEKKLYLFQICLGIPWAAEATPEIMMTMRNALPSDTIWSSFGISRSK